jgi:phosphatidylserine/phosphatidylglycerophosphate/cardiolipin synthase-like enzyme
VNFVENLVDGNRLLPVLLRDLDSATRCIHIAIFLFFDDPIGEEISGILEAKARAGVAVRVLLNVEKTDLGDPFGTGEKEMMKEDPGFARDPTDVSKMRQRLSDAGVAVVDTELDYDKIVETGEPELDALAQEIKRTVKVDALHVDHRKIVTIDGRVAYCGSANFGAQYQYRVPFDPAKNAHDEATAVREAGQPEPWWKWHDGLARFEGSIVFDLDRIFRERWRLGGGADFRSLDAVTPSAPRGIGVRSARVIKNEPSSRTNEIREAFLDRIRSAERSIFIENPFLYHPAIVDALVGAKRERPLLDVTVIVPAGEWTPNKLTYDAQQHHYAAYLDAGLEVFEYQNHFSHLKLATFDMRWVIVGSANLNFRSLEDDKDFEACVLIDSEELARNMDREVRAEDIRWSRRIAPEDVQGASWHALRVRSRGPRTLMLIAAREL